MAHEELKKQYEEDCKNFERPWELWSYRKSPHSPLNRCSPGFTFCHYLEYRRKEPASQSAIPCLKGNTKTITLCGSTKFRKEFEQTMSDLTLQGHIVISVGLFGHETGLDMTGETKRMLDRLHFRKIDLSDEIYVINPGGYIGLSTCDEIHYAIASGKPVHYMVPPHPTITIAGVELPMPEVEAPEYGTRHWVWKPQSINTYIWMNVFIDKKHLNYGLVHLTEDRAQAWASWWRNTVMAASKASNDLS